MKSERGLSRATKTAGLALPLLAGENGEGASLVVAEGVRARRARIRTPEAGESERGVSNEATRAGELAALAASCAPVGRWVSPTLTAGAGATLGSSGRTP